MLQFLNGSLSEKISGLSQLQARAPKIGRTGKWQKNNSHPPQCLVSNVAFLGHIHSGPLPCIYIYTDRHVCLYIYIYIWQLGHLLPTLCSEMPIFPKFYSKNGSNKNLSIYGQFFCIFLSRVSWIFNQFLEDVRIWTKKTCGWENLKIFFLKICFWLGKC